MVCLELPRVTGCFSRYRDELFHYDQKVAFRSEKLKISNGQEFRRCRSWVLLGDRWQTCAETGSYLMEKGVLSSDMVGIREPRGEVGAIAGPNVARHLATAEGLDYRSGP